MAFAEAAQVSEREARRIFARNLTEHETGLIASFREGLDPGNRRAFWQLYKGLLSNMNARGGDLPRTVAMHHLKAAGALSSKALRPAAAEILTALRTDFRATLGWLATRYINA